MDFRKFCVTACIMLPYAFAGVEGTTALLTYAHLKDGISREEIEYIMRGTDENFVAQVFDYSTRPGRSLAYTFQEFLNKEKCDDINN